MDYMISAKIMPNNMKERLLKCRHLMIHHINSICNNVTVQNISKLIPFSTFDFQFPESQAANNPNMFQFQQKTPFMSTVPQDVVKCWAHLVTTGPTQQRTRSPVITSQNKKTDNSFHNMDKILEKQNSTWQSAKSLWSSRRQKSSASRRDWKSTVPIAIE